MLWNGCQAADSQRAERPHCNSHFGTPDARDQKNLTQRVLPDPDDNGGLFDHEADPHS
jgi:hypothetical protein